MSSPLAAALPAPPAGRAGGAPALAPLTCALRGVFAETAGGVTVAAAAELAREGKLRAADELVPCITGNGFETVEAIQAAPGPAPVIDARLREVAALVNAAR